MNSDLIFDALCSMQNIEEADPFWPIFAALARKNHIDPEVILRAAAGFPGLPISAAWHALEAELAKPVLRRLAAKAVAA